MEDRPAVNILNKQAWARGGYPARGLRRWLTRSYCKESNTVYYNILHRASDFDGFFGRSDQGG
jgi:hypothetical protein